MTMTHSDSRYSAVNETKVRTELFTHETGSQTLSLKLSTDKFPETHKHTIDICLEKDNMQSLIGDLIEQLIDVCEVVGVNNA